MKFNFNAAIRSSFLPPDKRAGTRLFLIEKSGWFYVTTRFQWIGRHREIEKAIELFEKTLKPC